MRTGAENLAQSHTDAQITSEEASPLGWKSGCGARTLARPQPDPRDGAAPAVAVAPPPQATPSREAPLQSQADQFVFGGLNGNSCRSVPVSPGEPQRLCLLPQRPGSPGPVAFENREEELDQNDHESIKHSFRLLQRSQNHPHGSTSTTEAWVSGPDLQDQTCRTRPAGPDQQDQTRSTRQSLPPQTDTAWSSSVSSRSVLNSKQPH